MAEAEQTTNPIRLLVLAVDIRKALDAALAAEPNNAEVRLDLVRFHAVTPRIAGGDIDQACRQIAEIARLDAALGQFAAGYLAYREKDFGKARNALTAAFERADKPTTKALAAKWLGWLSQETQQWQTAFTMFDYLPRDGRVRSLRDRPHGRVLPVRARAWKKRAGTLHPAQTREELADDRAGPLSIEGDRGAPARLTSG